jgi:hypothetical protein
MSPSLSGLTPIWRHVDPIDDHSGSTFISVAIEVTDDKFALRVPPPEHNFRIMTRSSVNPVVESAEWALKVCRGMHV